MADAVNNIALVTTSSKHLTDEQKVKLQKATREFESIFVGMMLKSMRSAQGEQSNELGGESYGGDVMKGMFDTELSKHIGNQGKMGIASSLYRKLTGEALPGLRAGSEIAGKHSATGHSAAVTGAVAQKRAEAVRAIQQMNELADDTTSGDLDAGADSADSATFSLTSVLERLGGSAAASAPAVAGGQSRPAAAASQPAAARVTPASASWTATTIHAPDVSLPPSPQIGLPAQAALTASAGLTAQAARRDAITTVSEPSTKTTGGAFDRMRSYNAIIARTADTVGVDANLLKAMIVEESGANTHARSSKNAKGLMQLIDTTAESMGVKNVWDPHQNIQGGARYLKQQLDKFKGDVPLALASYNAGPGNVEKYNGIPPFRETQNYVKRVMKLFSAFQRMENQ